MADKQDGEPMDLQGSGMRSKVVKLLLVAEIMLDRNLEPDQDPRELARQHLDHFREAVQPALE